MTISLPSVIARYSKALEAHDVDTLVSCFTEDAAVTDEGQTMHGRDEIRAWRDNVAAKYQYTIQLLEARVVDGSPDRLDHHAVATRLEGNFPGSPVDLTFRFGLDGDLIATLEIAP